MRILKSGGLAALALLVGGGPVGAFVAPMHMPVLPPNYTANIMQAVVLNPCQAGTPCGDAAARKYNISPNKVLPSGGMAEVERRAAAHQAAAASSRQVAAPGTSPPAMIRPA